MARSITEIKLQITNEFIGNTTIISKYGLVSGQTFEQQFSIVSLENILFSIIAFCLCFHEQIVNKNAEQSRPHSIPWYRNEFLNFLDGLPLVWQDGQFKYDLTNVTDAESRKIIDRCAVLESNNGELVIKIATDNGAVIEPVTAAQLVRFKAYCQQIKDAGNRLRIINDPGDLLKSELTVEVDPLIIDLQTGRLLSASGNVYPVKDAIKNYLQNLEFNGAFVREFYRDAIQKAEGVKLPIINVLESQYAGFAFEPILEKKIPEAGYFIQTDANLTIIYKAYDLANN